VVKGKVEVKGRDFCSNSFTRTQLGDSKHELYIHDGFQ